MKFKNLDINEISVDTNTAFIGVFGYEERSDFIYKTYFGDTRPELTMIFVLNDKKISKEQQEKVRELEEYGVQCVQIDYSNYSLMLEKIRDFLDKNIMSEKESKLEINIDYSSMPRLWYCSLPCDLEHFLEEGFKKVKLNFWYSEGEYPVEFLKYPTKGVSSYNYFSGVPSIYSNKKRTHFLGVGFDSIRTGAMISVVDPTNLVTCYMFEKQNLKRKEVVKKVNEGIFDSSSQVVGVLMNDFESTVSKLVELAFECSAGSNIVVIPDGPKPLILAMSLIPRMLSYKIGVVCMLVARNSMNIEKVNVIPNKKVHGFLLTFE